MIVQRLLIAAALAFVAALPYLGWLPGWTLALATVTAFGTVSLIGLNLIYGVTGMLALGQAAATTGEGDRLRAVHRWAHDG